MKKKRLRGELEIGVRGGKYTLQARPGDYYVHIYRGDGCDERRCGSLTRPGYVHPLYIIGTRRGYYLLPLPVRLYCTCPRGRVTTAFCPRRSGRLTISVLLIQKKLGACNCRKRVTTTSFDGFFISLFAQ